MCEGIKAYEQDIEHLEVELQQQRGMLWLLGEIMKAAVNIISFKELMSVLTDMLMGVMGVTTCYLWYENGNLGHGEYTVFYRSIELKNEFKEIQETTIPLVLDKLNETHVFSQGEIEDTLIETINIPCSRLAVPLRKVETEVRCGMLVLEHEESDFFTPNTISFFETLAIFITCQAESSRLIESVEEESIKDPLTETYNRRHLKSALNRLCTTYEQVTAAIVDTDNFKTINDVLGHIEGDMVLKAIAQLAKSIVKESDGEVIRYGGDEFVILIPKPLVESLHIFEEFRKCVHYLRIAYDIATEVSVTLGVCSYPEIVQDYNQLIKVADSALLKGKVKGKNRVVLASDEDIELD